MKKSKLRYIQLLKKLKRMVGRGEIQETCELIDKKIEEVKRG